MSEAPPPSGERKTWPRLGIGLFVGLVIVAALTDPSLWGGAWVGGWPGAWLVSWLVPIIPLVLGAWRWGPKGILLMIPVAFLAGGICVSIVMGQVEH